MQRLLLLSACALRAAGQATVTDLHLINAATGTVLRNLTNGSTVNLAAASDGPLLNVVAVVSGAAASVLFSYDGNMTFRTANTAPFTLSTTGWTPARGTHYLSAIPFEGLNADGVAGKPFSLFFNVVDNVDRAPTTLRCELFEWPERVEITDVTPEFSWVLPTGLANDFQTAYRVLVATTKAGCIATAADMWDSGEVSSNKSVSVMYLGKPLQPSTSYYWRVATWNRTGTVSEWSSIQMFKTAAILGSYNLQNYPVELAHRYPVAVSEIAPGHYFFDFGKDAFGYGYLRINAQDSATITVNIGEAAVNKTVNMNPGVNIRASNQSIALSQGMREYRIQASGSNPGTIQPPPAYGRVTPFRYVELIGVPLATSITTASVVQMILHNPFDPTASSFNSSQPVVNAVYDLCKYTMFATSFLGIHVDGDRERLPYEADAFLNQLSYYAVDRDLSISRYSNGYLMTHPTWPTEWKSHSVMITYTDYMYTGDMESIEEYFRLMEAQKTLEQYAREDGLIAPQPSSDNIVDWPVSERDGYVLETYNTVVNAFYYRALNDMSRMAHALSDTANEQRYADMAKKVKHSFNSAFFSNTTQRFIDGEGTTHSALHANAFPLAHRVVDDANVQAALSFVKTRGMVCSVYGAQYLLDGLYDYDEDDYAMSLLNATNLSSWYNMMRVGSTLTMEAWDESLKPNLDWNHAWGAAAGNIIVRQVLGVQPTSPGYATAVIKPHLGSLTFADGKIPTIRGYITVFVSYSPGTPYLVKATIPGNMVASVELPELTSNSIVSVDGVPVPSPLRLGGRVIVSIGSGVHSVSCEVPKS
ncbi:Beta-galactosidase 8 [Diplonema papillatum]|nr:Beta-galactosidase 8 [Diplonema papillatum]